MSQHNFFPSHDDDRPLPTELELSQDELRKLLTDLADLARKKGIKEDPGGGVFPIDGEPEPTRYAIPVTTETIEAVYTHDQPELTVNDAELTYVTPHKIEDDPLAQPVECALLSFNGKLINSGVDVNTSVFIVKIGHELSGYVESCYTKNGVRVDITTGPQIDTNGYVDGRPVNDEVVE